MNVTSQVTYLYAQINTTLAYPGCQLDSNLKATLPHIDTLVEDTSSLIAATGCTGLSNVWDQAVNQGLCTHLFTGLYATWVSQFVTSGCLFFTVMFVSVLYQYYGDNWTVTASYEKARDVEAHIELPPTNTFAVQTGELIVPAAAVVDPAAPSDGVEIGRRKL